MEHESLIRLTDLTQAEATIQQLTEQLSNFSNRLARWELLVEAEVNHSDQHGFHVKLTITKKNGKGFVEIIPQEDAINFLDDTKTLTLDIAEKVARLLYEDEIKTVLEPLIIRGVRNAVLMAERAS